MPFGKYNNNENFWRGFDLPHSKAFDGLHVCDVLSYLKKRYGCEDGDISGEGKDVVIGLAASLLLQGFGNPAKYLLLEGGIKIDRQTKRILNYAAMGGQMRLEERIPPQGETESFTDSFLNKLRVEHKL